MKTTTLARLAFKHAYSHAAEEIYLKTEHDYTKPVTFYGLVNERCNVKCRYCEYWRLANYKDEMSIDEWQKALLSVKEFVGTYSISFSGGEPLIKPGFLELMAFCHAHGIHSGVTTNGSALNRKNAQKLVAARPFNLNVSVDAPDAALHDYLRGWPGLFQKLSDGIKYVREERDKAGLDFPIIIKTTVNSKNFRVLPDMVSWVKQVGATALNFQPVDRWTPETYDELWIEESDQGELRKVVDAMLALKRRGEPIMNNEYGHRPDAHALPRRIRAARGDALPSWDARLLHPHQWRRRSLLLLSGDRQHQGAVGARDLVRSQGARNPETDYRLRSAMSIHLPIAEDLSRQGEDGLAIDKASTRVARGRGVGSRLRFSVILSVLLRSTSRVPVAKKRAENARAHGIAETQRRQNWRRRGVAEFDALLVRAGINGIFDR